MTTVNHVQNCRERRSQRKQHTSATTDLDGSSPVHGDAVVGLLGQLVQSHHRALVDGAVFGLEVVHKGGHGPGVAEGRPVAAPHAAAADGLGQVAEESVVGLLGAEKMKARRSTMLSGPTSISSLTQLMGQLRIDIFYLLWCDFFISASRIELLVT